MRKYERMRSAIYKCLLGLDVVGDLVKGIRVDQISRGVWNIMGLGFRYRGGSPRSNGSKTQKSS